MEIVDTILNWEFQNGPIHIVGSHLYYLIVLFILLTWALGRWFFGPLLSIIGEREGRVDKADRAQREAAREEREKLEAYRSGLQHARREAFDTREEARQNAMRQGDAKVQEVRADASRSIEEAKARLGEQVKEARDALQVDAREMGRAIAQRVLGRDGA